MSRARIKLIGILTGVIWVSSQASGLGASIGLNLMGGWDGDPINYPPSPVTGLAGATGVIDFRQANWNNLPGAPGMTNVVVNDSGAVVPGVQVTWVSSNTWTGSFFPITQDDALMFGYIDDSGGPTPTGDDYGSWLIVSNIPYSSYHVVIYAASDDTTPGTALGGYAVGLPDGRLLTRRTYGGHPAEFDSFFGWHRIPPDQIDRDIVVDDPFLYEGDHVVFPNLTESDLMLIAIWEDGSPWKTRATIPAIQIVEASLASSDGDTLPDEWELIHFGNLSQTDLGDPDGDGLVNTGELANASNPNLVYSDTDLLTDAEDVRAGFSPVLADTDGDTIPDDEAVYNGPDTDMDGLSDPWEYLHFTNLNQVATNDVEPDGLTNIEEQTRRTDPNDSDTDDDGLVDGVETDNGYNSYVSPTDTGSDPLKSDTDGDTLSDGFEVTANPYVTDPTDVDTDGDLWTDQVEISFGTDPTDSGDFPVFVPGQFAVNFPCINGARFVGTTAADFRLGSSDTAGAPGFAQQDWNNAVYSFAGNGSITNLNDETGAVVPGLTVVYTAPTTWGEDGTVMGVSNIVNGDTRMLAGYLDDGNIGGAGSRVTVSNIPYAMYDLVLYFTGDGPDGSGLSSYTVENSLGQRPPLIRDPIHALNVRPKASAYIEVPDTAITGFSAERGNCTVYHFLRESVLTIVTDPATDRSPLNGFQIISRDPLDYPDLDGDGMSDQWETNNFPGMTIYEILPGDDPEPDGLNNVDEFLRYCDPNDNDSDDDDVLDGAEVTNGTDPTDPDTEGDGLEDGVETDTGIFVNATDTGSDPLDPDTDDDGLKDGDEVNVHGTDPNKFDTDADTFGDQIELAFGADPTDANSKPPLGGGLSFQLRDQQWAGDEQLPPSAEAGLIPLTNWNDVFHTAAQPLIAVDQSGTPTLAEVRWSLGGLYWPTVWDYSTWDGTLAAGYFDDQDAPIISGDGGVDLDGIGVSVTVSNVPFAEYAVILYRDSDQGPGGQYGTYTVNGIPKTVGDTSTRVDIGGWVLDRNALLYPDLTNSTLTIRIQSGAWGAPRGPLCGFQILNILPDPAVITDFVVNPGGATYSITWDSASGAIYRVQSEGDLVNGPWSTEPGAASIAATNTTSSWSGSVTNDNANYRVIRNPFP